MWKDMAHSLGHEMSRFNAKVDVALASAAMSAPLWLPSMADTTSFFVMLSAIGGFILICLRIWRAWKNRDKPAG
ncbi:MAG: hypothetical protein AB7U38_01825 [Hyphomicrobiales bacterium]